MNKVQGNTSGIRRSYIEQLEKIYDMEIEYHLSETSTARIPIEGQVRWCKPDVNPSHFAVGFKITKIEPNMKIRLKQIISYLKFRN